MLVREKEKVKENSKDSGLGNRVDNSETYKESQGWEWMEEMSVILVTELEAHGGQNTQVKQFNKYLEVRRQELLKQQRIIEQC